MKNLLLLIALVWGMVSCTFAQPKGKGKAITHEKFTRLLKKYVDEKGLVDYAGFKSNSKQLQNYLDELSSNAPADSWTRDEKYAYWVNAYNAFTIKLIVDNYPVKSIKDLGPKTQVIFVNTPWDKKFFSIGGKKMDLNNIEHGIMRKQFDDDPRFHFALNCASMSCPKLRNEAYEASKLDAQLTDQAKDFLADVSRNDPKNNKLSSIFKWYGGDFKLKGKSKIDYINQYSPVKLSADADVEYMSYDWKINEQK